MQDPAKQKNLYKILKVTFGIAGFVWIVYGLFTPNFILFPLIGLVNWGIAWYCAQLSKNA